MTKKQRKGTRQSDPYTQIRRSHTISIVVAVLVIIGAAIFIKNGRKDLIYVEAVENGLLIRSSEEDQITVPYDELTAVTYLPTLDAGTMLEGQDTAKVLTGRWENDQWGEYRLYYLKKAAGVIALTRQDETIVFNYESAEVTRELYESIRQYMTELGLDNITFSSEEEAET